MAGEELIVDNNMLLMDSSELPERAYIWDETLRGGEQTAGVAFTVGEKLDIAKLLDEVGVSFIDAGFPIYSREEAEAVRRIAAEGLRAPVGCTVRALKGDVDAALACDVSEVHMFMSTSRFHLHHKDGKDPETAKTDLFEAIRYAVDSGLTVDFVSEDTARSDLGYVREVVRGALDIGVEKVVLCDTVSVLTPYSMFMMVKDIRKDFPGVPFGIHCHNDFNMATANTVSAVCAGVTYPTVTVNGLGDSSGNPALEEVVMALERLYGVRTGIRTERLYELSKLVERLSGLYIQPQKPIVGLNAFRHESDVHVKGVLAHTRVYEPMKPEDVGQKRAFVLGKHSGPHQVRMRLKERGIEATDAQVEEVLAAMKSEIEARSKEPLFSMMETLDRYNAEVLGFDEGRFWELVERVLSGED